MIFGPAKGAPPPPNQLPTGAVVMGGTATINTVNSVNSTLTINQTSNRAVINWNTFDIGTNATVNFLQPSAASVVLNRVNAANPIQIFGSLNSNGVVYLINTSGMYFAPSANVNVGSILATTQQMDTLSFMNGGTTFRTTHKAGQLLSEGSIRTSTGGYIALMAPEVQNSGVLIAEQGTIALVGGNQSVTLSLGPSSTLNNVTVAPSLIKNLIHNHFAAPGPDGSIVLSSQAVDRLRGSVINSGTLEANGVTSSAGRIILKASNAIGLSGTLSASAANNTSANGGIIYVAVNPNNPSGTTTINASMSTLGGGHGGNGGSIETSASNVLIGPYTNIRTTAAKGLPGTWIIDPNDFTIAASGGNITGATVSSNLASTDISILSTQGTSGTSGNININDPVNWSSNHSLTLNAQNNIIINSPITATGSTAKLILQYGQSGLNLGNTSNYLVNAPINLQAGNNFSTQLGTDGAVISYVVLNSLGAFDSTNGVDLQGINGTLGGNFALGSNIVANTGGWNSGNGFTPIGSTAAPFTGNFDGLGHTIANLIINQPGTANMGLFGVTSGLNTIQNIGLTGGNTIGGAGTGGLIGYSGSSLVSNSYNTGTVTGAAGTGGLVGSSTAGNIANSYATGVISGAAGSGGLEGSVITGSITNSYATGNVSGAAGTGGLIGSSTSGNVTNSYATGNVNGAAGTGGLVGSITSGSITDSYAVGSVSGGAGVGGIVGATSGAVNSSVWNLTSGPGSSVGGGLGLTTTQMQQQTNFAGWDFNNTWLLYPGLTFPLLKSFMTSLIVTATSPTVQYDGHPFLGSLGVTYSTPATSNLLGAVTFIGPGVTAINIGTYPITPSGLYSNQTGYIISYAGGNLTITQAPLRITGATTVGVYNASAQTNTFSTSGLLGSDTVTGVSGQASGTNYSPTAYADTLSTAIGTGLSNYSIAYTNGSLSIGRATLTVNGANNSAPYNSQLQTNNGAVYTGQQGSDTFTISGYASALNYSATPYADNLVVSGAALANYTVVYNNGSLSVGQATLSVMGSNNTVQYNGFSQNNTGATYSGQIGGDTFVISGYASGLNYSASPYADHLVASGASLSNYLAVYVNGSLSIGQAPLSVVGANNSVKYSGISQNNTVATYSGQLGGDTFTISGYASGLNYSTTPYSDHLSVMGGSAGNYKVTYNNGSLTIEKATLTLTGANNTLPYNGQLQTSSGATYTGQQGSDSFTIEGLAQGTNYNSIPYSDHLTANGSALVNYAVMVNNGSLSISKTALTVNGSNQSVIYNGLVQSNLFSSLTVVGLKGGDTVTSINGLANGKNYTQVPYSDNLSGAIGAGLSNYNITYTNGSLSIGQAALTVSVDNATKIQNTPNPLFTSSVAGFKGSDNIFNSTNNQFNYVTTAGTLSPAGVYVISSNGLVLKTNNYSVTNDIDGILTITDMPIVSQQNMTSNAVYKNMNPSTFAETLPCLSEPARKVRTVYLPVVCERQSLNIGY
jgi:filamentous hemagglutinin family protein